MKGFITSSSLQPVKKGEEEVSVTLRNLVTYSQNAALKVAKHSEQLGSSSLLCCEGSSAAFAASLTPRELR